MEGLTTLEIQRLIHLLFAEKFRLIALSGTSTPEIVDELEVMINKLELNYNKAVNDTLEEE